MGAFVDARTVPSGTVVKADLAIIGGGPAGIAIAMALAATRLKIVLLESGGLEFDAKTQSLYEGAKSGPPFPPLDASRLRFLGGSSNHWGGWCRPFDEVDFEAREALPHSGWPIAKADLDRYFIRAHELCEAGTAYYDAAGKFAPAMGPLVPLGPGGLTTRWFQFSRMRGSTLPTHFGERYGAELKKNPRLTVYLQANVTRLGLTPGGHRLKEIDVATLNGKRFTVRPKAAVLATGAIESARLMLASNDVIRPGVGNRNGMVGRFFADHPIPRDNATLVLFGGAIAPYYLSNQITHGAILRAGLLPDKDWRRRTGAMAAAITVENPVELDPIGKAAVAVTAGALGVNADNAVAYSLGCGMEIAPDPDRRITLTGERDRLGMPKIKLAMKVADSDFAHYRETLKELGRQLLVSRAGMLKRNLRTRDEWYGNLDWGNHHMGTLRMHADPKRGVVDADAKVHGMSNLYVAGSSIFTTYGAANPTVNLLALALRLADHLKGKLR